MTNKDIQKSMENYKSKFFYKKDAIDSLYQNYKKELTIAYKKHKGQNPANFITEVIKFMLSEDFDPNFIRAIFGIESSFNPITKEDMENFKNIFINQMLK